MTRLHCGNCEHVWTTDEVEFDFTCPNCKDDGYTEVTNRRLTQQERLQALADSGVDTWEEYRNER